MKKKLTRCPFTTVSFPLLWFLPSALLSAHPPQTAILYACCTQLLPGPCYAVCSMPLYMLLPPIQSAQVIYLLENLLELLQAISTTPSL